MAKAARVEEVANTNDADDQLESVMEYSEDISDAQRPDPLPVGEYHATITKYERKVGKESGRPYAQFLYTIGADDMPADYATKWEKESVTIVGRHFILEDNPNSRFNAKRFCEAIGLPMSRRMDYSQAVTHTCRIKVGHSKDLEGNDREDLQGLPIKA